MIEKPFALIMSTDQMMARDDSIETDIRCVETMIYDECLIEQVDSILICFALLCNDFSCRAN